MNRIVLFSFTLFFLSFNNWLQAQQLDHVLGEILIQSTPGTNIQQIIKDFNPSKTLQSPLQLAKTLQVPGEIHKLQFDYNRIHEEKLLQQLRQHPQVLLAQFNHLISYRQTTPNDPQFTQQWQWFNNGSTTGSIDANLAWDIGTGGTSPQGDEIVVAIIDNGTEPDHPDLAGNLWTNQGEIPDNGIDDDNNGYVDDFYGWNINREDDSIRIDNFGDGHGVSVAGMAGAVGNNNMGVTGVNWKVKLMTVKNADGVEEALVLEAYSYPYTMRKRYNDTNGQSGAFVVATNASWGLNLADPEDAPIWCAFYDSLGSVGILNCAATTNSDTNVDTQGDLPTTCTSEYLLAVTRTGKNQEQGGGYGPINIDLGAPGINVFTTERNQSYRANSGTSLASPLVAGMVGFLYSIPGNQLTPLAKADPAAAALLARDYILDGVKKVSGFEDLVASAGIANLNNSAQMVLADATACLPPFGLKVIDRTDVQIRLGWTPGIGVTSTQLRWRIAGSSTWTNAGTVSPPYLVTGLSPCNDYEFQLASACGGQNSAYSETKVFSSDGCCVAPDQVFAQSIGNTTTTLSWTPIFAAISYDVSIRPLGSSSWTNYSTVDNSYTFNNLMTCESYEARVRTICNTGTTNFSDVMEWSTIGCGNCEDLPYCDIVRNTQYEYIDKVVIAGLTNESGDDGGYAQFFALPIDLKIGETYPIQLTPGYPGFNYTEDFQVWIDYNQDGDFADPGEDVLFIENVSAVSEGSISIPETAPIGNCRMRITIYFMGPSAPCEAVQDGETEDYCVNIIGESNGCETTTALEANVIDDYTVQLNWEEVTAADTYLVIWKKANSVVWEEQRVNTNAYLLENLTACTTYDFQVKSTCSNGDSPFSSNQPFKTSCVSATEESYLNFESLKASPNPFTDNVSLDFVLDQATSVAFELLTINGQMLQQIPAQEFSAGAQRMVFSDLGNWTAGVYLIRLKTVSGDKFIRVVKMD